MFNVGVIVGVIYGGWFGDCFNLFKVFIFFFIVVVVLIIFMGLDILSFVCYLVIVVVGVVIIGS